MNEARHGYGGCSIEATKENKQKLAEVACSSKPRALPIRWCSNSQQAVGSGRGRSNEQGGGSNERHVKSPMVIFSFTFRAFKGGVTSGLLPCFLVELMCDLLGHYFFN